MRSDEIATTTTTTTSNYTIQRATHYYITNDSTGARATWEIVLQEFEKPSSPLVQSLIAEMSTLSYDAFYFECIPARSDKLEETVFEFALINAPRLSSASVDTETFEEHFDGSEILSFDNLGRDATLVVPGPKAASGLADYEHIARFIRSNEPIVKAQAQRIWKSVASAVCLRLLSKKVVYVSTDGSGVSYLHFRVEDTPKYYKSELRDN